MISKQIMVTPKKARKWPNSAQPLVCIACARYNFVGAFVVSLFLACCRPPTQTQRQEDTTTGGESRRREQEETTGGESRRRQQAQIQRHRSGSPSHLGLALIPLDYMVPLGHKTLQRGP